MQPPLDNAKDGKTQIPELPEFPYILILEFAGSTNHYFAPAVIPGISHLRALMNICRQPNTAFHE